MSVASTNFIADGPTFRVNTETDGEQRLTQVTALGNGTFYVVWASADQDGDRYGVYGQMFDADGNPIGSETQINTYTSLDQVLPQVTAYGDGNFVVVWQSFAQDETVFESYPDDYWAQQRAMLMQYGVYGQRFDSIGQPIGDEFLVNTETRDNQHSAQVVSLPDGGFIVVWRNWYSELTYFGEPYGSYRFQRYDADGNPVAGEVVLDTYAPAGDNYSSNMGTEPEFTVTNDGRIVATWISLSTEHNSLLYFREFALDGTPLTDRDFAFGANRHYMNNAAIAALPDGGYIITVTRHVSSLSGSDVAIFAQIYDVNGVPRGAEFRVSDNDMGLSSSRIVVLPDGRFVVAWTDDGIYARLFDSTGVAIGEEIRMSDANFSQFPDFDFDLAVLSDGRIILTGNGGEINGRIFEITGEGLTDLFSNSSDTVTLPDIENNVRALSGDDNITGGNLDDIIRGEAGNDTIHGNAGDDRIFGGAGTDVLNGGIGSDIIAGGLGADIIHGDGGDDIIYGEEGNDQLYGGIGDDYIESGAGADTLWGGDGNDQLIGNRVGRYYIGDGTVVYGVNTFYGENGNDYLRSGYGDDFLYGGDGDDRLIGGFGDNHLEGGAGNDILSGGRGVNTLIGGEGNDIIYVGFDGSTALGGVGDDTFYVTPSYSGVAGQVLDGGSGVNTLAFEASYDSFASIVYVDMSQSFIAHRTETGYLDSFEQSYSNFSNVTVTGNYSAIIIGDDNANHIINAGGNWRFSAPGSNDSVLVGGRVSAGGGDDIVEGGAGRDILSGDAGDDIIIGYDGDDYLYGGFGNDRIVAGSGENILNGDGSYDNPASLGGFADEFVFVSHDSTNVIEDFEVGIDKINVEALLVDAGQYMFDLNGFNVSGIRCFESRDFDVIRLRFVQNGSDTEVYFDYTSSSGKSASMDPLITLRGVDMTTLSYDDFIF